MATHETRRNDHNVHARFPPGRYVHVCVLMKQYWISVTERFQRNPPESIVNQPKELYEPVCLCLVSRYPFFDILQVCGCIIVALLYLGERSVRISEVA